MNHLLSAIYDVESDLLSLTIKQNIGLQQAVIFTYIFLNID